MTATADPRFSARSLVEPFLRQTALRPDAPAVVGSEGGLSYRQLLLRSSAWAAGLRARGVARGDRVGLLLPRQPEAVAAILGILRLGAAYVPLDPAFPAARVRDVLEDAGVVLLAGSSPAGAGPCLPAVGDGAFEGSDAEPDDLAYLIYTSGSTGRPKGVRVRHRSVLHLLAHFVRTPGVRPDERVACLASLAFDMTVPDLFGTLGVGATLLLAPDAVLRDGRALGRWITEQGATLLQATPSALRNLVQGGWTPSPGTTVVAGGEVFPPALAHRLRAAGATVWNGYGITETTVYSTFHAVRGDEAELPLGEPLGDTRLHVLGPDGRPVPPGEPGELLIAGPGVSDGYEGRPELTAERFVPDPDDPAARAYRSGDRVVVGADGLRFLGRVDRQVQLRGYRVELGEVEAAMRALPEVTDAAATVGERGGEPELRGYVVLRAPVDLRRALADRLPPWMIPARVVELPALPLGPTGKLDRRSLPEPSDAPAAAPDDPLQARLGAWMGELLDRPALGADEDFFAVGGQSLLATELAARVAEQEGAELDVAAVFDHPSPRALARRVAAAEQTRPLPAPTGAGPHPCTSGQRRLWFLHALNPGDLEYHVNLRIELDGPLDEAALRGALASLQRRHEALRTLFEVAGGEPRQRLVDLPPPAMPTSEPADPEAEARAFFRRPFDLERGPVWRAALQRRGPAGARLLLGFHHVAIDGWSASVLLDELAALLAGEDLPPPGPGPAALAAWEAEALGRRGPALEAAWRARLEGLDPSPALPSDGRMDAGAEGGRLTWRLDPGPAAALRRLGESSGATPFHVLLAAFGAWMRRLTGQWDFPVATFVAGRAHPALRGAVGYLAGTVPLRLDSSGAPSFRALVGRAREVGVHALAHGALPLDRILAAAGAERRDAFPYTRAAFVFQAHPGRVARAGALRLRLEEVDNGTSPFPLLLQAWDAGESIEGDFLFRSGALSPGRAEQLLVAWEDALRRLLADPDAPAFDALPIRRAELEAALRATPEVEEAAVLPVPDGDGAATVGFCVGRGLPEPPPGVDRLEPVAALPLDGEGRLLESALRLLRAPEPPGPPRALAPPPPPPPPRSERPALREGPPLVFAPDDPTDLEGVLRRAARLAPDRGVVDLDEQGREHRRTWPELLAEAERVRGGLYDAGLAPGDIVLLHLDSSRDYTSALWGCFLAGVVPLGLATPPSYDAPGAARTKLQGVHEALHRPPVLAEGRSLAGLEQVLPAARRLDLRSLLAASPRARPGAADPDDLALLLLTSGSTGLPKPVRHHPRTILAFLAGYCARHGLHGGDVFLNWLGLDHVAPLLMTHLAAAWCAAEQVNAPTASFLARPTRWLDWTDRYRASVNFAPNFAFGLVADAAEGAAPGTWDLSCFRAAMNGGESIVPRTARRFTRVLLAQGLPPTAMLPIWGMSETLSATITSLDWSLETTSDEDPFTALGDCVPGFAMRIADEQGRTLREGEVGRLQVRGASVLSGYHERPDANAEAFRDGWFDTGDLAFIDARGMTLTGRAKDVIVVRGVNYYCHAIEDVAEREPGVLRSFCAAVPFRRAGSDTDELAVFVVPEGEPTDLPARVRRRVAEETGLTPRVVLPVRPEDIPKTEIGKIQRSKLRGALESGAFDGLLARLGGRDALPGWFFVRRHRPRRLGRERFAGRLGVLGGEAALLGALASSVEVIPIEDPARLPDGLEALLHLRTAEPAPPVPTEELPAAAARALGEVLALAASSGLPLLVASRGAQPVAPRLEPAWGPLLGLLATLPQEQRGRRARHVELGDTPAGPAAEALLRELAFADAEPEAAWVGGRRLVPRLAAVEEVGPAGPDLARPWLLAGGLGGVGRLLASHLAKGGTPLVLLGRRPESELDPDAARALAELRATGPVRYLAHDVALPGLSARVPEGLGGVVQLAALARDVPLRDETQEAIEAVLRVRLLGTARLAELAARDRCAFVDFGSVNGLFGGFAAGAYSAGSRAGELLAEVLRRDGLPAWHAAWSRWEGRGLTADRPGVELGERRGFLGIDGARGLRSFDLLLRGAPATWVLGIDPTKAEMHRVWDQPAVALRGEDPVARPAAPPEAPRDERERRVAAIWGEVLDRGAFGIDETFFELGGESLQLVQVHARLEEAFSVDLPLVELFRHPTVRSLAERLGGEGGPSAVDAAKDRAARMRAARRGRR